MYKLTKDNGKIILYDDRDPFFLVGEYNEDTQTIDWEEDIMIWGNTIAEFETEEELVKAYLEMMKGGKII